MNTVKVMWAVGADVKNDEFEAVKATAQAVAGSGIVTLTDGRQTIDQGKRCDLPVRDVIYGQVGRIVIGES